MQTLFNTISLVPIVVLAKGDEKIYSGNTATNFIELSFNLIPI
ncbi:MAG: hypothetical protein PHE33_02690 [Bacteroidales bacterium]|nr:hypothetical protein [Bacteroidales bacterium]